SDQLQGTVLPRRLDRPGEGAPGKVTASAAGASPRPSAAVRGGDDPQEVGGLEAGAADQPAIDIVDGHYAGRVVWLHRAAKKQPDAGARVTEALSQHAAKCVVHLGYVRLRRRPPGSDRPDGLVGDDGVGGGRALRQRGRELAS